jgi:hypothetical protein
MQHPSMEDFPPLTPLLRRQILLTRVDRWKRRAAPQIKIRASETAVGSRRWQFKERRPPRGVTCLPTLLHGPRDGTILCTL